MIQYCLNFIKIKDWQSCQVIANFVYLCKPNFNTLFVLAKVYIQNHSMIKKTYPIIFLFILSFIFISWGNKGHYTINNKCPESFPVSMADFRVWSDSLSIHGSDADNRKNVDKTEGMRHYIDIDNYAEFKSTGRIASTYDSIVRIHGESFIKRNGTLPWATRCMYDSLKVAFQQQKWHKAMLFASDLGHYVADGHMPMHLTANYDGDMTNQSGIHSRYESVMVGKHINELSNYTGKPVHLVSNINNYIFNYIYNNQLYLDSLLEADNYAKNMEGDTFSAQYYQALWSKTHFTTLLFHNASHSLAELIYTAWIEAGSPAFGIQSIKNSNIQPNADDISVYPNPTTGSINLTSDDVLKVEVCTISGILQGIFYDKHVDLTNLPNGMYILSIYRKNGLLQKNKILLAK